MNHLQNNNVTFLVEIRWLGMGAVDSDFSMKTDYAHPTSQKRGDIAVTSDRHLELTNAVDRYPRPDFIIDVKVCAMVTADGDLKASWNADKKNSASMRAVMLL